MNVSGQLHTMAVSSRVLCEGRWVHPRVDLYAVEKYVALQASEFRFPGLPELKLLSGRAGLCS
jgi:hypothetical protein